MLDFKRALSRSNSQGREHSNGDRMHMLTLGQAKTRSEKNTLNRKAPWLPTTVPFQEVQEMLCQSL